MRYNPFVEVAVIVLFTAILLTLTETGNLSILWKLPFITIYIAYAIGRMIGIYANKKIEKKD